MVVTNRSRFSWDLINSVLFLNLNWSPRAIVKLLSALPSGSKEYTWGQINSALTLLGFSPKHILKIMIALGKAAK